MKCGALRQGSKLIQQVLRRSVKGEIDEGLILGQGGLDEVEAEHGSQTTRIVVPDDIVSDKKPAQDYICDLLGIPAGMAVLSIITAGYPDEVKEGHKKESLLYDKVFRNRFGNPWEAA